MNLLGTYTQPSMYVCNHSRSTTQKKTRMALLIKVTVQMLYFSLPN